MVQVPPTPGEAYRNTVIRLPDLFVTTTELGNLTFENCRILGPAVLIPRNCEFAQCSWEIPSIEAMYWEIDPRREAVLGAVGLTDCMFSMCTFALIGLAGP